MWEQNETRSINRFPTYDIIQRPFPNGHARPFGGFWYCAIAIVAVLAAGQSQRLYAFFVGIVPYNMPRIFYRFTV
jgi:hypothetical protein